MSGPIDGVRVLDFCFWQQGPHCGVMLADMGAEVVKVELPGAGDPGRRLWLSEDGFSAYFEAHNRGKKGITLDLHKPQAVEIAKRLIERSDVLVESFRRGFMERIGLGYEDVHRINPRLVYASASGFGPDGPWRERLSFDLIGQAMGGLMMAQREDENDEPRPAMGGVADQLGSIMLAYGTVLALLARERDGIGQKVDSSLLGSQIALQSFSIAHSLHNKKQFFSNPKRRYPTFAAYKAKDGRWVALGVPEQRFWPRLCRAIGLPNLECDPRFATDEARQGNSDTLVAILQEAFQARDRDEWVEWLAEHDVPAGPVYEYPELGDSAQAWENDYLVTVNHSAFGSVSMAGIPVRLSETPGIVRGAAPALGEHTNEVLLSLGYRENEIEEMRRQGII